MRGRRLLAVLSSTVLPIAVILALGPSAAGPTSASVDTRASSVVCRFTDDRFREISGLTYSLRSPDVLWLHNDSGDGPYIYAVSALTCRTLATVRIDGIEARDVEAIAAGRDARGRPVLWIADIGDNLDSWADVRLHRIREPKVLRDQTVSPTSFRVTYRDRPHDAEALLVDPVTGGMWIVTKQLAHGWIYSVPRRLSTTKVNIARPVRGGQVGGLVTDGAVSPDGTRFVLRDYADAGVAAMPPPGTGGREVPLPLQPQGEAITWTADSRALLVASERDDRLIRVDVN